MLKLTIIIISALLFLTGCVKQSTVVSVNLPVEEIEQSGGVILSNNTNSNVNTSGNINLNQNNFNTNSNSNSNPNTNTNSNTNKPSLVEAPVQVEIPAKLELEVAFAPQAPYGNWNELNEEACEEASIITVAKYFLNQPLDEKIMETEIIRLDSWEKDRGYKIDLSALETASVLKEYFNLTAKVVDDVSVDRIKYELSLGNLIIVPAAGRELDNPYFRDPGPIYHMLVIKGYDENEFIVNEVGTKRGDSFRYKYQQLIGAVHDWDPSWSHYEVTDQQMTSQPKKMIIVSK